MVQFSKIRAIVGSSMFLHVWAVSKDGPHAHVSPNGFNMVQPCEDTKIVDVRDTTGKEAWLHFLTC